MEGFYAPFALILDHIRGLIRTNERTSSFWDRMMGIPALAVDEVLHLAQPVERDQDSVPILDVERVLDG